MTSAGRFGYLQRLSQRNVKLKLPQRKVHSFNLYRWMKTLY